ncbi:MAG TPA: RNA polymerase sigma factor [Kofleriaceae bacterium]|nr:RNA polymerase sigma factor [Kofleriaceae bacterium]
MAELMRVHGDAVFGFCLRMVHARDRADDLVQQVFLEAFRDLDSIEGSSPRAWLFGIAYHRCLDALKTRQHQLQLIENSEQAMLGVEDPGRGMLEHVDRMQLVAGLEECLRRLSPAVRATVLMRFQTGATYEEMEVKLGATPDALQVRVARALPVLRRCLEKKGWSGE